MTATIPIKKLSGPPPGSVHFHSNRRTSHVDGRLLRRTRRGPRAAVARRDPVGTCYDLTEDIYDFWSEVRPQVEWVIGAKDETDARAKLKAFTLKGVLRHAKCPGHGHARRERHAGDREGGPQDLRRTTRAQTPADLDRGGRRRHTLAVTPTMIVVSSGSRYQTLSDLLDEARAKPGEVTMASIGPGTGSHIAFEMLVRVANIRMTFVPYPGTAPAVGALLGEHVTSAFADYPTAAEHVKARRLRALAVASPARIASLPDVPTVAESGFKDYDADRWYRIVAPRRAAEA